MTQLRKRGVLGFIMREKNGTCLRKKKKKKKEETEELCDWVVGFKMRGKKER